jgi:enoyl reductase-like protein
MRDAMAQTVSDAVDEGTARAGFWQRLDGGGEMRLERLGLGGANLGQRQR